MVDAADWHMFKFNILKHDQTWNLQHIDAILDISFPNMLIISSGTWNIQHIGAMFDILFAMFF